MNTDSIRHGLEVRRHELEKRLGAIENDLGRELDDDSDDRAIETENDEVLVSMERSSREELKAVNAALGRIENGSYGSCVLCGAPISEARLEALPFTPYCVDCARDANPEAR